MKRFILLLLLAGTAGTGTSAQSPAPAVQQVQHDKQFLLQYYQQSYDNLQKEIAGLSDKQLHFKPAPDKWSISQCLEHIITTEQMLLGFCKQTMAAAPNPERKSELKMSDEDVMNGITDRSHKAQAPKEVAPSAAGKYNDPALALADLKQQRTGVLDYLGSLSLADMRDRITDSPFGPVDAYHMFLYMPGHTARHTLQIAEIKADKNFPKR